MGGTECISSTLVEDLIKNKRGRFEVKASQIAHKRRITEKIDTIEPVLASMFHPTK